MVSKVVSVILLALATLFLISSAAADSRDLADTTTSDEDRSFLVNAAAFEGIGKIIGKIARKFLKNNPLPDVPKEKFCHYAKFVQGRSILCCPSYKSRINTPSCANFKFGSDPTPRPCCLVK